MASDAAALLTGPDAGDLLAAALGTRGLTPDEWRVDAVNARPGAETSVGYAVEAGGESLYLVASTVELSERRRAAAGAVRLESEEGAVHVWLHPSDPRLTGLPTACRIEPLQEALTRALGRDVAVERLDMLVLRPLRRAVLRATVASSSGDETWYVKAVRPSRAAGILERHALCALAPRALDLGDGVLAIAAARGVPLTQALHRPDGGTPARVDPEMLMGTMRGLPREATRLPRRPSVPDRLDSYAGAAVARGLPEARIAALAAPLRATLAERTDVDVATHGDLHPANVFVDSREAAAEVTALIDIDTLGPGRLADDCAAMVAHLLVLPALDAAGYPTATATGEECFAAFARQTDAADLRARVAAHLLALASGTQDDATAATWLGLAEDVASARLLG